MCALAQIDPRNRQHAQRQKGRGYRVATEPRIATNERCAFEGTQKAVGNALVKAGSRDNLVKRDRPAFRRYQLKNCKSPIDGLRSADSGFGFLNVKTHFRISEP